MRPSATHVTKRGLQVAGEHEAGVLYYLVGPSGVGKDTLLNALAADGNGPRVARRYITRAPDPAGEQNHELTAAEFARRDADGEFLFSWRSHGNCYAVGNEIRSWLEAGDDVAMNGSREYLATARSIYPGLRVVWMTVDDAVLRRRLAARGRETAAEIEARIARNREFEQQWAGQIDRLDNSGPIEAAVTRFAELRSERGRNRA